MTARDFTLIVFFGLGLTAAGMAIASEQDRPVNGRQIYRALRQSFSGASAAWRERLVPDQTMATCSAFDNRPPKQLAEEIKQRERPRIRYPEDGNFIGDWRRGQKLAQSGYGMRFSDYPPKRSNGGNCYACHQLSPDEVSFGTIGVSLKGYGNLHKGDEGQARLVYDKIFNSQAVVACSLMPRFGANGILTPDQIKDLVAYLMDPESPVNK